MLGNASLAELSLGEAPQAGSTHYRASSAGSFAETGVAATFNVLFPVSAGAITVTGQTAGMNTKLAPDIGAYQETGQAALLSINALLAVSGAYLVDSPGAPLVVTFLSAAGSYALTYRDGAFATTMESWTNQSSGSEAWVVAAGTSEAWTNKTVSDYSWTIQ